MSFFRNLITVKPGSAGSPTSQTPTNQSTNPSAPTPRSVAPTPTSKRPSLNQQIAQPSNRSMRVLIRGDRKTGKSALLRRLNNEPFIDQHCITPIIQSICLSINYKTTDQMMEVEVWDVVDTAVQFGTNPSTNPPAINSTINQTLPIDASTALNLYKDVNAIVWLVDPTNPASLEYVKKHIMLIDRTIDCLIVTNFRDLPDDQRVIDAEKEFKSWLSSNPSLAQSMSQSIRFINLSIKNGFGMKHLMNWLNIPFLSKRIRFAETTLARLREDLSAAQTECDLMNEADYSAYLSLQTINQSSTQPAKLTAEQIRRETEKRIQQERVNALLAAESGKSSSPSSNQKKTESPSNPSNQQSTDSSPSPSGPTHSKKLSIGDKFNQTFKKSKSKPADQPTNQSADQGPQLIKIDKAAEKAALNDESVDDFVVAGDDSFFGDDPSPPPSPKKATVNQLTKPDTKSDSEGEFADEEELEPPTNPSLKQSAPQTNYEDELDEPDFDELDSAPSPFGVGGSINQAANQSITQSISEGKDVSSDQPTTQSTTQASKSNNPPTKLSINPSPFAAAGNADFDSEEEVDEPVKESINRPKKQYDFDLDADEPSFDDDDVLEDESVKKPAKPSINTSIKQSKSSFYSDDDELDEPTTNLPSSHSTKHKDRSPKSVHFDADDDELDQHDPSINRSITRSTSPPAGEGEGELAHQHAIGHKDFDDLDPNSASADDQSTSMITIPVNQSINQTPDPDLAMFDSPKKPTTLTDFYGKDLAKSTDQSTKSVDDFGLDLDTTSKRRSDDEISDVESNVQSPTAAVKVKPVRKVPSDDELELDLPDVPDKPTPQPTSQPTQSKKESRRKKKSDSSDEDDFFNATKSTSNKKRDSDDDIDDQSTKSKPKSKSKRDDSDDDILVTLASKQAFSDSESDTDLKKEKDHKRKSDTSKKAADSDSEKQKEKEKDRKRSSRRSKEDGDRKSRDDNDDDRDSKSRHRDREDRDRRDRGDREDRDRDRDDRDKKSDRDRDRKSKRRSEKEKEKEKPVAVDDRFLDMFSVPDDGGRSKDKKREKKKSRRSSDDSDSDASRSSKHRDGDKDRKHRDRDGERKPRDGDKERKSKKKSRRSDSDSDSDHSKRGKPEDDFYSTEYKGRQPAAVRKVVATSSNGDKANSKSGFFSNLLK